MGIWITAEECYLKIYRIEMYAIYIYDKIKNVFSFHHTIGQTNHKERRQSNLS